MEPDWRQPRRGAVGNDTLVAAYLRFMPSTSNFLNKRNLTLLRAAMGRGEAARDAYLQWRETTVLDQIDYTTHRALPLLYATAKRFGLVDADTPRIRGIAKHIWLSNMLRLRLLSETLQALEGANIQALVLKGGALFARNPEIAAQRMSEDYDIQIYPHDATRALKLLIDAGLETYLDVERLAPSDFIAIHAAPMSKHGFKGEIDLHWRPLPDPQASVLVNEMFASAEIVHMANRAIRVPDRAMHLFLAVARADPSDSQEAFFRAIEAAHLIRDCAGQVDWLRFLHLTDAQGAHWRALNVLRLIRDHADTPVPNHVLGALASRVPLSQRLRMRRQLSRGFRDSALRRLMLYTHPWRFPPQPYELRTPRPLTFVLQWVVRNRLKRAWKAFQKSSHEPTMVDYPYGFSVPNTEGRWTTGELAIIELSIPGRSRRTVTVEIVAMPFVPPGRTAFNFRAFAGVRIERHSVAYSDKVYLRLPAQVSQQGKTVIALQLDDARSPSALGLNTDSRFLGLLVKSVAVLADGSEINAADGATRSPS